MDPRYITLVAAAPTLKVTALRGQTAPVPTGGFGGWTQVARPRRKALTQWDGVAAFEQAFSIIFDGVTGDTSVEADCRALERMAQPATVGAEPPIVRALGAVPHPELNYVISALDWDPAPFYSPSMYRTRQEVVVHLLEYVADDRLAEAPAAERARRAAAAKAAAAAASATGAATKKGARTYTVKKGDTLSAIAAHQLGSYKRWPEIAKLNNIRDPKKIKPGQVLKLP